MKRDDERQRPIDLGAASRRTRGAEGKYTDLVGMMDHWSISKD